MKRTLNWDTYPPILTFHACLWAMIALFLGGAWGITTAALVHAARDEKKHKEDDEHDNN